MKKEAQYLLIAIVLTLAQVTGLVYVAAQNHFSTAYANFCRWDCVNYARIADEGMPTDIDDPDSWPVKYGFFPGLPVMAKIVMTLTNLERQKATVLTSQLFTVSFCFYVLALLGMLELTLSQSLLAVGFLLSFPTAFFLVAGYSESSFLTGLLGFIYWFKKGCRTGYLLSGLHGLFMSATRIVGIPLVVIPLLMTWIEKSIPPRQVWARKKEFQPALLVALVASLGCLSFFVHCHFHTGHWNAYMIAQYRGWKIVPNIQDNYQFNALSVPFIMSFYVAIVLCEAIVIRTKGFRSLHSRSLYYFCSWGLFFVAAAAFANGGYQSMLRYNFCAVVLALFGIAPTLRVLLKMYPGIQTPALACYMGLVFVQMMIQGHLGFRYMAFAWVA